MSDAKPDKRFNVPVLECGQEAPPCCPVKLRVSCGHGSRGYILDVPGKPTKDKRYVLQAVADKLLSSDGRDITDANASDLVLRDLIRVDLISTSCRRGFPSAIGPGPSSIVPPGSDTPARPAVEIVGTSSPICFPAPYGINAFSWQLPPIFGAGGQDPVMSVLDFFGHFLVPQDPYTYGVAVRSCDGSDHFVADVEIFPKQQWEGELTFQYGTAVETVADGFKNQGRRNRGYLKEIRAHDFKASCSISAQYLDRTISVEFPVDKLDYVRKVTTVLGKFRDVEELAGKANKLTGVSGAFKIAYPAVKVSGKLERKEKKGDWSVEYAGELKLKFDPLIGLKAEVDLLDALIAAAGAGTGAVALSKIILIYKEAAAEKRICEVSLKLSSDNKIFGELNWGGGFSLVPAGGELGGEIGLKLQGVVAATNEFWNVSAGANLGGESKFAASVTFGAGQQPALKRKLNWSGISIFYSVFVERTKGAEHGVPPKPVPGTVTETRKTGSKDKTSIKLVDSWSDPPEDALGQSTGDSTSGLGAFLQ